MRTEKPTGFSRGRVHRFRLRASVLQNSSKRSRKQSHRTGLPIATAAHPLVWVAAVASAAAYVHSANPSSQIHLSPPPAAGVQTHALVEVAGTITDGAVDTITLRVNQRPQVVRVQNGSFVAKVRLAQGVNTVQAVVDGAVYDEVQIVASLPTAVIAGAVIRASNVILMVDRSGSVVGDAQKMANLDAMLASLRTAGITATETATDGFGVSDSGSSANLLTPLLKAAADNPAADTLIILSDFDPPNPPPDDSQDGSTDAGFARLRTLVKERQFAVYVGTVSDQQPDARLVQVSRNSGGRLIDLKTAGTIPH